MLRGAKHVDNLEREDCLHSEAWSLLSTVSKSVSLYPPGEHSH